MNARMIQMLNRERKRMGLGELPLTRRLDDEPGRMIDPGAGLVPEFINNYKASNFPFIVGTTSVQVIPANPLRCYVLIQNKDAVNDMFLNFGADATQFNGVIIIPRGNYELIGGGIGGPFSPSDSINILGGAANMRGVVVEGILPPVMP